MAGRGKGSVAEFSGNPAAEPGANPAAEGGAEPGARPRAPSDMSAHLQPAAAPMPPAFTARPAPNDADFDRWLRQELSRLYDAALSEPIPPELLRLLAESERD